RFQVSADSHFFAVGYSTFDAAGAIRRTRKRSSSGIIANLVVYLRARASADLDTRADLDGFHGWNAHDCLSETAVDFSIPLRVRAEPRNNAARDDLEDAAERVLRFFG